MRRAIERFRNKAKLDRQFIMVGGALAVLAICFALLLPHLSIVTVNNANKTLLAASETPEAILALVGVKADQNDEITYTASPEEGANILVNRSFPVNLTVDGETVVADATEGTVGDFLQQNNIVLGEGDLVMPEEDTLLERDMEIVVGRVTYEETSRRVEASAEELEAFKATLSAGDAQNFVTSKSRIYDMVYQNTLIDGRIAGSQLVDIKAVYHPYDDPSAGFEAGVPVSTIDAFIGVEIGPDGIPTSYTRKMESAVATAYSASAGRGAGGQGLYCGTVAVNPNVIPYGTRLYITAADGSFVYGYAIASDCGTAMMEGYVDVDLYFESNAECRRFGKRQLDVYILD